MTEKEPIKLRPPGAERRLRNRAEEASYWDAEASRWEATTRSRYWVTPAVIGMLIGAALLLPLVIAKLTN